MEDAPGQIREGIEKGEGKESGDSGPAFVSSWQLFAQLLFLQDSVRHRK